MQFWQAAAKDQELDAAAAAATAVIPGGPPIPEGAHVTSQVDLPLVVAVARWGKDEGGIVASAGIGRSRVAARARALLAERRVEAAACRLGSSVGPIPTARTFGR